MKPLVSVIVPVYKVEDVLVRCLDSLCRQSLQDIEIILVDDGSPDRCGEICEEYAAKDVRFKVIHHPENRGLSAARNTGITHASADYLMFVDSDDYVHEDFCKLPYECAVHNHADLVMFRHQRIVNHKTIGNNNTGKQKNEIDALLKNGCKTKTEALDMMLFAVVGPMAWNKLYHKALFGNISYPAGFLYEDWGTSYKTIFQSSRIYYLDTVLYYNCNHKGSITTLKTAKSLQDWFTMVMQLYHDLAAWGYSAEKLDLFLRNTAMSYCIKKKRDLSNPDYAFCANVLQSCETIPEGYSGKRKVLLVLFKYCPPLFELVCTLWGTKYEE